MARTAMEAAGVHRCKALSLGVLIALIGSGAAAAPAATRTVTLITGDQVVVTDGEKQSVSVIPRKGREQIVFSTTHQRLQGQPESLMVIPSDAQALIDADRLDRRLFNITTLLESNYDDSNRQQLPLVVTYEPQSSLARAASTSLAGATITSTFASVNGVAAKPTKQDLGRFWDTLTGTGARTGAAALSAQDGAIRKIWLDVHYKLSLEHSVPQIGAPQAWQSGYDGTGTVVGIIDTGLDTTHPDLVGKMVVGTGFTTPDGGTAPQLDQHGHGTHVAGIIAGTGAASNGRYRGVAPGAQLAIFDACDPIINGGLDGCTLSTILEGVHWMAEQGVKVVNMSLGTGNTPEIDPLEEAIQRLSEQYGMLYVIAAGNSGVPFSIDSPGSTPAALTVGAVDKSDQIASFSSRGPLPAFAGYAIKPDVTAPGQKITSAAASEGSETGGGSYYVEASGTSMATPHAAAAAAILLQRHPDWTGDQLKSALMGTAQFKPNTGIFDQGAGRIEVPAALASTITTVPQSLSLGFAEFPHEDNEILTRTVTYRNDSNAAQSLTLRLDVVGPNGAAPPAGMFSLDRTTLTLPAKGTATVTLTANTRVPAEFGWFSGKLVATGPNDSTFSVPLAIHREEPMYDLTLRHIDREGSDAEAYTTTLVPIDRCMQAWPVASGVRGDVTLRIPVARYAVQSHFKSSNQTEPTTLLLYGDFAHNGAASLTLDARNASLVANTPPTATAASIWARAQYEASTLCGTHSFGLQVGTETDIAPIYLGFLGQPAAHIRGYVSEQWLDSAQADDTYGPALYAAAFSEPGRLPVGAKMIPADQMSVVRARYAAPIGGFGVGQLQTAVDVPGSEAAFGMTVSAPLPLKRAEYYYSSDPDVRWTTSMFTGVSLSAPSVRYDAGAAYMTRWNEPPFAPVLPNYNPDVHWASRSGNSLTVRVPILGDRQAHVMNVFLGEEDGASSTLYRNGVRIAQSAGSCTTCLGHQVDVPPELATYRLESEVTQRALPLSTRVAAAWTFQSQNVPDGTTARLPLITLQFKPILDDNGAAPRNTPFSMPVSVNQLDQQGAAQVSQLTIEASFDDGASWTPVPVTRNGQEWLATVPHPQQGEYVSLRATATGASANTVEITVIRAYALTD